MQDSHTVGLIDETTGDPSPLRLVSAATMGLPQWLHGRVDEHLARVVVHMREGLLAASTAVGPEVMAELMQVEATELVRPQGPTRPDSYGQAAWQRAGHGDLGRAAACGASASGTHRGLR
jgi:hypothetical protein